MEIHGFTKDGMIEATIDRRRLFVPDDMGNRHRQMIAEWEAEGNTIPPYVAPPADLFPDLNKVQFAAVVEMAGLGAIIEAAIDAIEDPAERAVARAKYLYSTSYRRDSAILLMLQPAVGISDAELDALWMIAKDLAA